MFGKPKSKVWQIGTLIDTTASLTGDIVTEGNLRIDGKFNGNIIAAKDVVVGESGYVEGQINAETMAVYGNVKGNIKSGGLVEIMSTGKVFGDIEVNRLVIKEGGIFEGRSLMKQSQPEMKQSLPEMKQPHPGTKQPHSKMKQPQPEGGEA